MKVKQRKERREKLNKYSLYYKRLINCDQYVCFYCGFPRQCLDHCPPLSVVDTIDIKKYLKMGGKFHLVPSCIECNKLLQSYPSPDKYSRMDFLFSKYEKKLNSREIWSQTEINELGHNLKTLVLTQQSKLHRWNKKLYQIDSKMLSYNPIEDDY